MRRQAQTHHQNVAPPSCAPKRAGNVHIMAWVRRTFVSLDSRCLHLRGQLCQRLGDVCMNHPQLLLPVRRHLIGLDKPLCASTWRKVRYTSCGV